MSVTLATAQKSKHALCLYNMHVAVRDTCMNTYAQVLCKKNLSTSVSGGLASDSEVDMALFGGLLHQLHHQLVRLAHHRRAVHTDELIARPQAPVLICRPILHYVPDVDLKKRQTYTIHDATDD